MGSKSKYVITLISQISVSRVWPCFKHKSGTIHYKWLDLTRQNPPKCEGYNAAVCSQSRPVSGPSPSRPGASGEKETSTKLSHIWPVNSIEKTMRTCVVLIRSKVEWLKQSGVIEFGVSSSSWRMMCAPQKNDLLLYTAFAFAVLVLGVRS